MIGSKGSDKVVSDDESDLDSLYDMTTSLGSKGSYRVVSDDKSDLEGSKVLGNDDVVQQYNMESRPNRKSERNLTR